MRVRNTLEHNQAFFLYTALIKVSDAAAVYFAWYACWSLRFENSWISAPKGVPDWSFYARAAWPLVLVYCAVLHAIGAYRSDRIALGFRPLKKIAEGALLGTLVFVSLCYFLDEVNYSRVYLILFTALVVPSILTFRVLCHGVWRLAKRRLVRPWRVLVVGSGELLAMYVSKIRERNPYPVAWVGRLGPSSPDGALSEVPHLGDEEKLGSLLEQTRLDLVVVSYPNQEAKRYEPILTKLSNELVSVKVLPDFGRFATFTYSATEECGVPLLVFNQGPSGNTARVLKRLFDFVGSAAFLILFSPVYAIIALCVKLSSKGPVFYSQVRVGADGKVFTIYKFRSMRTDAEASSGAVWAVEGDPRVTPVGRFLRSSNLDEIPQFFNVLRGDMSLVGPRPERPEFVSRFRQDIPKYMLRHRMKSGLTGWAQVNGWRGNTSIDERIKHDLFYIGHWSHLFDIKILCLTLARGFFHRNAY